jgi:hypothetical protein
MLLRNSSGGRNINISLVVLGASICERQTVIEPCDFRQQAVESQNRPGLRTKKKAPQVWGFFLGSGGRTRTCDLVVMSHTSCHCSTPRYLSKLRK